LFAEGKDLQAQQYLDELIDRQTTNARDRSYAVISLCNIANRCSTAGRRDVGFACLTRAVELPHGLDAILYLQIGNEFRSIREFDKAIACYEKAKAIDDGSKADSIRDEIIRVSVAKGEYERALEQYLTIDEFNFLPSTHTSLGTLYRKMGSLADARQCYWKVIKGHHDFNHVAKIGLAETAKQSGNLRQAFRLYNDVLRTENIAILDQGAHRVYELGRGHLYRLTGQFEKAVIAMNGLLSQFPLDHEIHFQLAKNYSLMGKDALADVHIKQASAPDLSGIAAELYAIAMHGVSISICPSMKDSSKIRIADYMPEDRGLASCKLALASIVSSDFESAVNILRNAHYVDKLHQDFGTVLSFHALKQLNSNFDYRRVQAIGRIAKRGYRPLRESVIAIAEGNYDVAIKKERRLCLLVA